jgi:hypothetical protein
MTHPQPGSTPHTGGKQKPPQAHSQRRQQNKKL